MDENLHHIRRKETRFNLHVVCSIHPCAAAAAAAAAEVKCCCFPWDIVQPMRCLPFSAVEYFTEVLVFTMRSRVSSFFYYVCCFKLWGGLPISPAGEPCIVAQPPPEMGIIHVGDERPSGKVIQDVRSI